MILPWVFDCVRLLIGIVLLLGFGFGFDFGFGFGFGLDFLIIDDGAFKVWTMDGSWLSLFFLFFPL